MSKYARKVDDNQALIVSALRAAGHQVTLMHAVGAGFPDLIICRNGGVEFFEVKGARGRLTPAQKQFFERWQGPPIRIVRTVTEALTFASALKGGNS